MPSVARLCHQVQVQVRAAPAFDSASLPGLPPRRASKRRLSASSIASLSALFVVVLLCLLRSSSPACRLWRALSESARRFYAAVAAFDWRSAAAFRVTDAIKVSIAMSLALGVLLGVGVGLVSGLEPAVVIGVSASMAMGCVFVMSFAILHGVNALRAVSFALFVSICLPFGFGVGFGVGILMGVFLGLEDPDDIREKTNDFVANFGDFVRVVAAFTLEIL